MVRRAGVALFSKGIPSRALPSLVQALRVDDDPAVLSAAAAVAEEQFDLFTRAALSASEIRNERYSFCGLFAIWLIQIWRPSPNILQAAPRRM